MVNVCRTTLEEVHFQKVLVEMRDLFLCILFMLDLRFSYEMYHKIYSFCLKIVSVTEIIGHAIAQAVSRRLPTVAA
jgi:hypothetical protein